jgi:hypothetical protein
MIIAILIVNYNNAGFAKQLIALAAEFTSKYMALVEAAQDDRKEARERWVERDRILTERLEKNTQAMVNVANEANQLRTLVTPLVLSVEAERKRQARRNSGDTNHDSAD